MTDEPLLWTSIQTACRELFREEPVLEMVVGDVYREVYGDLRGQEGADRRSLRAALRTWAYPTFFLLRNLVMRLDERKITVQRPSGGARGARPHIFVVMDPRDNDWGCLHLVLRRFDELGHASILFATRAVWMSRRAEISQLKHCTVVLLDLLKYTLSPMDAFATRAERSRLLSRLTGSVVDPRLLDFIKRNRPRFGYWTLDLLQSAKAIGRILEGRNGGFILTIGVYPAEFRWALAGRRLGIRTYVMAHGFFTSKSVAVHYLSPSNSDEILLWGPASEPEARKVCGPDHKVSVLGNPVFDRLINEYLNKAPDPSPLLPLGFREGALTLVFFSGTHAISGDVEKHLAAIRALHAVKRSLGDRANVVVKLHPHEGREHYERELGEGAKDLLIVKEELPLYQLIRLADIAVSIDSTTLLEAMVMGVPTLQLSLSAHGVVADFHEHGAAVLVRKEEELLGIVGRALSGDASMWTELKEAQRSYLARYVANLGTATERYIEHLLGAGGGGPQ